MFKTSKKFIKASFMSLVILGSFVCFNPSSAMQNESYVELESGKPTIPMKSTFTKEEAKIDLVEMNKPRSSRITASKVLQFGAIACVIGSCILDGTEIGEEKIGLPIGSIGMNVLGLTLLLIDNIIVKRSE